MVGREHDAIWANLPDTERQTLLAYRGFDSRMSWPALEENTDNIQLRNGLADISQLTKIEQYYQQQKNKSDRQIDLLLLEPSSDLEPLPVENFEFIGYDVGVLNEYEEPVFFSIILHEVRRNGNTYLSDFTNKLNDCYLFNLHADCDACIAKRIQAFEDSCTNGLEVAYHSTQLQVISIFLSRKIY